MNYITLKPEVFFNESRRPSIEHLSYYCNLETTTKFIYEGKISSHLYFPNIIKANIVETKDITKQFPDMERVKNISYYVDKIPDIGNLKSADIFQIHYNGSSSETMPFIRKYVNIIDENRLIINGKELKVNNFWKIDFVVSFNYKEFGF